MRRLARLPVRWRLALTSAGLTLAILLLFAVVMGTFTARQLRANFDRELRGTVADLEVSVRQAATTGAFNLRPELLRAAAAGDAAVRIVDGAGRSFAIPEDARLGRPREEIIDVSDYRVVTEPVEDGSLLYPGFVQYGKSREGLDSTIARVNYFLAGGVLAGTALALLAGLAVARRAMAPVVALTRAAQDIARTRDPAVRLPPPRAEDEVADLSRTLEQMLMNLDDARAETEATLAQQRRFVADASHELRTPLTSILANLELLQDQLDGENAEMAESALRSSRRMRRLVADLLLLARADAGHRSPRSPVDVGAVLRDAAAEAGAIADDHEILMRAGDGLLVAGSGDDLHRMARNLVENAISHTPAGTQVNARAFADGQQVVIEVSDDGPGVPDELSGRVFERFVSGAGELGGGTGLGLAIVRAVAESHGGMVRMDNPPGGGARFTVRLPAADTRMGDPPSPRAMTASRR